MPLIGGTHVDSREPSRNRKGRSRQDGTPPVTCLLCLSGAQGHPCCSACGVLVGPEHHHSLTVDGLGRCGDCNRAGFGVARRARNGEEGWNRK